MEHIKIGLIGFGVVGQGVFELLKNNIDIIQERSNIKLSIKTICDLKTDEVKAKTDNIEVTSDWKTIINDDEISIIVELIGGITPAKEIILEAFKKGKSVVTANKKLLAEDGEEIFDIANSSKINLGFEASVAGGIPCILSLKHGLTGNRVRTVMGILNGTTNYILSKMKDENLDFNETLKDAQEKGFAEADPTFDIEGFDAGHKIALLSMIAFNKKVDYTKIPIEGITQIKKLDIDFASEMGYTIKLLGISKTVNGKLDIKVRPAMIPETHPMAAVRNEYNAVLFDCDMTDPIILYGKGAGSFPTASAVVSDIIQIASQKNYDQKAIVINGDAEYVSSAERISRYYLRLQTENTPGKLAKITGVFEEFNISISSVIQKEKFDTSSILPLIFMTHEAPESEMQKLIKKLESFDFIHNDVMVIEVEDSSL